MATQVGRLFLVLQLLIYPTFLLTDALYWELLLWLSTVSENIAFQKYAFQHGTYESHWPYQAVDGNLDQDGRKGGCAVSDSYDPSVYTTGGQVQPAWWTVDMGAQFYIQRVKIYNRVDQFRESIRYSTIKAGSHMNVASQTECAQITEVEDLIYKQCNPIAPVRYLSIVASTATSLNLCEVEIEGYSATVFRPPNLFQAPTVIELRQTSVVILITPPSNHAGSYQILYKAMTGNLHEQYGNKTTDNQVETNYLIPGTQYDIQVLALEGDRELAKAISRSAFATIPHTSELPRLVSAPTLLFVGPTDVKLRFDGDVKARTYLVEAVHGGTTAQSTRVVSVSDQIVYTASLGSLLQATSYTITITPYTYRGLVKVRGIVSPPLTVTTTASAQPEIQSTAIPHYPSTRYQAVSTLGPLLTTRYPPPQATTLPNWFMTGTPMPSFKPTPMSPVGCLNGNGPECRPASKSSNDWVVPTAGGVAGGVALLLVIILVTVCVCQRRRKHGANEGLDARLARQSAEYEDHEAMNPQYYSSTLPQRTVDLATVSEMYGSTTESGRAPAPALPSKVGRPPAPPTTDPPVEDENQLHDDIDMLYAKINKGPTTWEGQHQ